METNKSEIEKCGYSCTKCKYNTKQKYNYDKHLLTEKHKKKTTEYFSDNGPPIIKSVSRCETIPEDSGENYKELFEKQQQRSEILQKQVDEVKENNSMLITKMLELTEKYLNLQNEQSKTMNNVTNNTFNNNQTYNINIYFNKGLVEIQSNVINPDTNTTLEFNESIPMELFTSKFFIKDE
jgi:hypothetical protein